MKRNISLVALAFALFSSQLWAETVYVQARKAKILASPSIKAEVVAEASKGEAVEIIEKQGRWLKVSYGEHSGWLSKMLVKGTPPSGKITVLDQEESSLENKARRRASAASSAAAARGLRSDDRARQSDEGIADFSAIREMESGQVSEQEATEFMEQGLEK